MIEDDIECPKCERYAKTSIERLHRTCEMAAIEYPITVNEITYSDGDTLRQGRVMGGKCGDMVKVRPCADRYENKTYLGILLGDLALTQMCSFKEKTGELKISRVMYNPAMFVPDLNEVIYGCGSYWSRIESANQLKDISDADIEGVWYVKALKQLETAESETTT